MSDKNHVELDWAVDAIMVGARHRKDLGDLQPLMDSIAEHGLLQPLTVTHEGVLVCGARRLAAIKQLGWRHVNVWVRASLSDKLTAMIAEREDQSTCKPYTVLEMADLYEELKTEIAADAARRQKATQFGPGGVKPSGSGDGNFPSPLNGGATRQQAAAMIGGASYKTLDKIGEIRQVAADPTRSDAIRGQAVQALKQIEDGTAVDPVYTQIRSVVRMDDLKRVATDQSESKEARDAALEGVILMRKLDTTTMTPADLDRAAKAALDRVTAARTPGKAPSTVQNSVKPVVMKSVKWFTYTWNELHGWTGHLDTRQVAAQVTDAQWDQFCDTVAETITFMDTVTALRTTG